VCNRLFYEPLGIKAVIFRITINPEGIKHTHVQKYNISYMIPNSNGKIVPKMLRRSYFYPSCGFGIESMSSKFNIRYLFQLI